MSRATRRRRISTRRRGGRSGRDADGAASVSVEWLRHLEVDPKKGMAVVGRLAAADIEHDARDKGRAGNNRPLPDLSKPYAKRKAREGGSPLPDLYRTGALWRTFGVISATAKLVVIGFQLTTGDQIKKWRKLLKGRRSPLKLARSDLKRFARSMVKAGLLNEKHGPPPRRRRRR